MVFLHLATDEQVSLIQEFYLNCFLIIHEVSCNAIHGWCNRHKSFKYQQTPKWYGDLIFLQSQPYFILRTKCSLGTQNDENFHGEKLFAWNEENCVMSRFASCLPSSNVAIKIYELGSLNFISIETEKALILSLLKHVWKLLSTKLYQ